MNDYLLSLKFRRCRDHRTGQDIGIVLDVGVFEDLDSCDRDEVSLWVVTDGRMPMVEFSPSEVEYFVVSPEPVTIQDLVHHAALLFRRVRELDKVDHDEGTLAYNQRNDFLRRIPELMNANDLANEFNIEFLKTCLFLFTLD